MRAAYDQLTSLIDKLEERFGSEPSAMLWMLIAGTAYFVMLCYTKLMTGIINSVQLQVYRGLLISIFIYIITFINKISIRVEDRRLYKILILRNFLGCLHNGYQSIAIRYIRISLIATINMAGPILICVLDSLIYKTKYTLKDKVLTLTNIFGVMLVANPTMLTNLFSKSSEHNGADSQHETGLFELMIVALQLFFVCGWGFSMLIVRELKCLNTSTVVMPFGVLLALISSLFLLSDGSITDISFSFGIEITIFIGVAGYVNQMALMRGMQVGKTGKASIFVNSPIVWGFLFEIFYLKETPNPISLLGSLILAGSSVILTFSKAKK